MIKAILFDKDGTLIEFQLMWHQIMTNIFRDLDTKLLMDPEVIQGIKEISGYEVGGFTQESLIQYESTGEVIKKWQHYLKNREELWEKNISYEELFEIFEDNCVDENIDTAVLDGVLETLEYCKQKNYPMGIATADTASSTMSSLQRAGIYSYFQFIGCDDGKTKPKPHGEMAAKFCNQIGIKQKELLIIGDSITDMIFAKECGAHFVGLKTPYNCHEQFQQSGIEQIEKISELIALYDL